MVRRSAPASRRWEAQLWRLCLERHRRHYVPCLTMSRNGEPLRILPGEIRSPPAKPADMTRHSFLLAADSSGRRGISPHIYSDPVVHAARMFSPTLSPSWQSSLPDEFVGFQFVRDQATRRVELARESSSGCIPARAGILQTARYAPAGASSEARARTLLGVKHAAHHGLSPPARGCWNEPILCRRLLPTLAGNTGPASDYKT
jgi:hypothetical protein